MQPAGSGSDQELGGRAELRELRQSGVGGLPGEALLGPDLLCRREGFGVVERGGGDVEQAGAVGAGVAERGPAGGAKAALDAGRGGVDGERPLRRSRPCPRRRSPRPATARRSRGGRTRNGRARSSAAARSPGSGSLRRGSRRSCSSRAPLRASGDARHVAGGEGVVKGADQRDVLGGHGGSSPPGADWRMRAKPPPVNLCRIPRGNLTGARMRSCSARRDLDDA